MLHLHQYDCWWCNGGVHFFAFVVNSWLSSNHEYELFLFHSRRSISECLNSYSIRYILAWISWSWKCCMECYNKVIFLYKLQLKWFVLFEWFNSSLHLQLFVLRSYGVMFRYFVFTYCTIDINSSWDRKKFTRLFFLAFLKICLMYPPTHFKIPERFNLGFVCLPNRAKTRRPWKQSTIPWQGANWSR